MTDAALPEGRCASCQAPIVWAWTETGRRIPLDAATEKRFVVTLDARGEPQARMRATYVAHFASCPNADQHRRPR